MTRAGRKSDGRSSATPWELIRRLKQGHDSEAWSEFYAAYGERIAALAAKDGLYPDEVPDLIQETVISVARQMPRFKADPAAGSFRAWLWRLVHWRVKNQIKKRGWLERGGLLVRGVRNGDGTQRTPTVEGIPAPEPRAAEKEEWQRFLVRLAMESLKRRVRSEHYQVFYLLLIKGQTPAQVGCDLQIGINRVRLIKHRVARQFRKIIKELEAKME